MASSIDSTFVALEASSKCRGGWKQFKRCQKELCKINWFLDEKSMWMM